MKILIFSDRAVIMMISGPGVGHLRGGNAMARAWPSLALAWQWPLLAGKLGMAGAFGWAQFDSQKSLSLSKDSS